jgi:AcrR family transcriptional regulator
MRRVRLTRAQQQEVTRERLLAAAELTIDRHGFAGASIDLISAEAGYSKGAIYSNFDSKESVFLELLRLYMERDMAALEQLLSLDQGQLSTAVTAWLENLHAESDCPLLYSELQLQARRNPTFAERYYTLQDQHTRTLGRILDRYFEAAAVPPPMDPLDLAGILIVVANGLTLQHPPRKAGTPSSAGRVIDALLKLLMRQ